MGGNSHSDKGVWRMSSYEEPFLCQKNTNSPFVIDWEGMVS